MGSFSDIRRASSDECSDPVLLALRLEHDCEFRFNPAGDSDLIPATIPI